MPLRGLPWSPEFMADYEACIHGGSAAPVEIGQRRTMPDSINAMLVACDGSSALTGKGNETQRSRRGILERFRAKPGDKRVATLRREDAMRMLDRIEMPRVKRNLPIAIRAVFDFAVSPMRMRDTNPFARIKGGT